MKTNNKMIPISRSKFNRILSGKTTENDHTNLILFDKILIILTKLPLCIKEASPSINLPCINKAENSTIKQNEYWRNLIEQNQLKNIFNYLEIFIKKSNLNINTDRVNNLLTVCNQFLNTNLFSSEFINTNIDAIAEAYLRLLTRITTLSEILTAANDQVRSLKFYDLLHSTNKFLQDWKKFNPNNNNSNFDILKNYVEAIGNLTHEFNMENHGSSLADFKTLMTELINVLDPFLTTDQKSDLRYTFVHQYNIEHELIECKSVFNSTDCNSNYISNEFNHIDLSTALDSNDMSLQYKLDIGNRILKTLNLLARDGELDEKITKTANLDNFLDYFKELIKEKNNETNNEAKNLKPEYIENLSKLLYELTAIFRRTNPQSKFYRSSFSLLLTLLKNPAIEDNLLHIPKAIEATADQMIILLNDAWKNSTKNPVSKIFSTLDVLDDIFHQANDIVTMPASAKLNIAEKIKEISFLCLKLDNGSAYLKQFLKTLGALNRNLVKQNNTEIEVTAIQSIAQTIVTKAQHNVTQAEYEGLAWCYLKGRHDKNVKIITKRCKEIFNLTHCQEFISANPITEADTTINATINTTEVPFTNPTTTDISTTEADTTINATINTTEVPFTNPTTTDISTNENKQFHIIAKLGTAIGLGAFSGFLNGGSQIILHIAEQKKCSLPTQRFLAVTLALANSLAISTLPLIYSIVENLANDETDSLVNSEKLLTCTYAFLTSIFLQGINVGVQCALPKKSLLKNLLTLLPLFTGLWMLANSDEGILEYISVLAANIITALATSSSLTYFVQKRFPKNRFYYPIETANENRTFEMEKLKEEKENNSEVVTEIEKNLTPEEIFFEKVKFTTPKQFNNLKQYLHDIIKEVEELKDKLSDQEHSNRLENILEIPETKQGLRYDLKDLEGFPQKFETEYNKCINDEQKTAVLRSNLDYFKTMIKTIYDKLLSDNVNDDCIKDILCSIETKTLKENINEIIKGIKGNLGFIRGITKPLISIHLSQKPTETVFKNGTAILFRQESKVVNCGNNRHTYHANSDGGSDTRFSSASEESSTLSAGSSKDGENIQINRCLI